MQEIDLGQQQDTNPVALWRRLLPGWLKDQTRFVRPLLVGLGLLPPPYESRLSVIEDLDELDRRLDALQPLLRQAPTRWQEEVGLLRFADRTDPALDPASAEYGASVLALYRTLSGRAYEHANEIAALDPGSSVARPFPYSTGDAALIGRQLVAIGQIIRVLDLPAGASVLEFGPGCGSTSLALAQAGYRVTVIDINADYLGLIRRRAEAIGVTITCVEGDFLTAERLDQPFDAVLFYESFHHALDHRALLTLLGRKVTPTGRIAFAAEPIVDDFPAPWGLRLDGESLWAIRRNGWLELGFRTAYFERLMASLGWSLTRYRWSPAPCDAIFLAERAPR